MKSDSVSARQFEQSHIKDTKRTLLSISATQCQKITKNKTSRKFFELPQVVQTVQKQTSNGRKLKFKQQTDFVFQAESVLFLF